MKIYSLKTDIYNDLMPRFSWKCSSDKRGGRQTAYRITVSADETYTLLIWDSGRIKSDNTLYIKYDGEPLCECSEFYWRVEVTDEQGDIHKSASASFMTPKKGTDRYAWENAEWIGAPYTTVNTGGLDEYTISVTFSGEKTGIVTNARNKDNYVIFDVNIAGRAIKVCEVNDNAWDGQYDGYEKNAPYKKPLGSEDGYSIDESVINGIQKHKLEIQTTNGGKCVTVTINGSPVIKKADIMPRSMPHQPYKEFMYNWGIYQPDSRAEYYNVEIRDSEGRCIYRKDLTSGTDTLPALGRSEGGRLIAENEFNLTNAGASVNVRRFFDVAKNVKRAVLYSSAMGFYRAYINGSCVSGSFYDPGFTDYRKRIMYQSFDVTDLLLSGENMIGATVTKGYYSGCVGYNYRPMIYGKQNYFIAQLLIEYDDGTKDIISTDKSWQFTDIAPVVDADYLQGEFYDARLEFDWSDKNDTRWRECGVREWPGNAHATNGTVENVPFELCPQSGPLAVTERVLHPIAPPTEAPKGHLVYDMGQNMVGTARIRLKGKRGSGIKVRYGEMCYKNGEVYIKNLRTAANTDVYILKGDKDGETFMPSFTSHGFRYIEITGNGCPTDDIEILSAEGIVITNTVENVGEFECDNELLNKLQSNIQWGQRGNSLLVFTDCPQRNERMGWTGDAQVFAPTAAYNMNVREFMNKWLCDARDAQLLYNRNGAVPDTAPLGGDNRRTGGCAGWGDAAVIVPWEMYMAYADTAVLEENYDMMCKWVEYQNRDDRKGYGMNILNGKEVPERSDLASVPYIQCQQSRGDHLSLDETTPFILSATAYAAHVADILSRTAEILGKTEDAKKYKERFDNIKRAFNEAWVCDDGSIAYWGEVSKGIADKNGSIINMTRYSNSRGSKNIPSQTAYALALDFELIDGADRRRRAAECFKEAIDSCGGHLSVGFLGISHLMPALTKCGMNDTAFGLLTKTDYPGWLYSVVNGATTIWERWNSYVAETDTFGDVSMNSFNHYSYGAVGDWMYRNIAGIKAMEPGYKLILLEPSVGGGLTYARGCYDSVHGTIRSEWQINGDSLTYKCAVPVNTKALLKLPDGYTVEDGMLLTEGVEMRTDDEGKKTYVLQSGEYVFEAKRK